MKVLLISPLPGIDPACGDVSYTQALLQNPPEGVQYEPYTDAVDRGALIERARRKRFRKEPFLTLAAQAINKPRHWGWLFWEPFRFFSIKPGEYDLVHAHAFSVAFNEIDCPLVISNSVPNRALYQNARNWSALRTHLVERIEIGLARTIRMNHCSYHLPTTTRVIALTEWVADWYARRGIMPADRIDLVPTFQENAKYARRGNAQPGHIGFIAKDFNAKGGPVLLKAFEQVRAARPDATLTIVGSQPQLSPSDAQLRGIRWLPYVPRDQLLAEILPSFDIFAYPTEFDGQPLVVLEAMACGIPVCISDYLAMPEMVNHGKAGLVSPVGDSASLAANLLAMLDPARYPDFCRATTEYFKRTFSAEAVRPKLRASYDAAIAARLPLGRKTHRPAVNNVYPATQA